MRPHLISLGVVLAAALPSLALAPVPLGWQTPERRLKEDFAQLLQDPDKMTWWQGGPGEYTLHGKKQRCVPFLIVTSTGADFDPNEHVSKGFLRRGAIVGFVYLGVRNSEGAMSVTCRAFRLEEVGRRRSLVVDVKQGHEVRYEYQLKGTSLTLKGSGTFQAVADHPMSLAGTFEKRSE